jgi:hypothetical protein
LHTGKSINLVYVKRNKRMNNKKVGLVKRWQ